MEKLLWVDMEMTGLNVEKEVIIEVAALVTDLEFNELHRYQTVVKQPKVHLDQMDDWNQKHHKSSGLLDLIPSGKTPDLVEADLLEILDSHFANEKAVIAGNSIAQDRLFIDKYFKQVSSRLHYRMLDVTSFKIMFANKFKITYEKKNAHRAIDDILESVGELKHYLSFVQTS